MYSTKTPNVVKSKFQKERSTYLSLSKLTIVVSFIFLIPGCNFNNPKSVSTSINDSSDVKNQPFSDYLKKSNQNTANLSEKYKIVRQHVLSELKQNSVYKALVDQNVLDQKYLVVLQAAGHGMISENNDLFDIEVPIENQLKGIPGGLRFVVNLIRLDIYGGLSNNILDVYARYANEFKVSGTKGTTIYSADGQPKIVIKDDFTLTEALTIFHYHYPEVLDDLYEAHVNGLATWEGIKGNNYRYSYLGTKAAFNNYLGTNYPVSKNYLHYDILITATELYAEYEENEVSADKKFETKTIAVSGNITKIAKDIMDNGYVLLDAGDLNVIQCSFNDSKLLEKLSKGDHLVIVGNCTGKLAMIVSLSECQIF